MLACADGADFEAVRSLKSLETLILPEKVNLIDLIDDLPNLKRVGNSSKADQRSPPTVAEFRKRADGKKTPKPAE